MRSNLAEVGGRLAPDLRVKLRKGRLEEDCEFLFQGRLMRAEMGTFWRTSVGSRGSAVQARPVLIPEYGLMITGAQLWVPETGDFLLVPSCQALRFRELCEIHSKCSGRKPGEEYLADRAFLAWAVDVEGEDPKKLETLSISEADLRKLAEFILKALSVSRDGQDLDGGELQEMAVAAGLWAEVPRVVPCGEDCVCSEFHDHGDVATCYVETPLGRRLRGLVEAVTRIELAPVPAIGEPVEPLSEEARHELVFGKWDGLLRRLAKGPA